MKNTRETRHSDKIKNEDNKSYWQGGCKYWKQFQLRTSYGQYK